MHVSQSLRLSLSKHEKNTSDEVKLALACRPQYELARVISGTS